MSEANTYWYTDKSGRRKRCCRACNRARWREKTMRLWQERRKNPPPEDDPERRQKLGVWGHEPGWKWLSLEMLDATCTHGRKTLHREFHGRRVTVIVCYACRRRVMVRRPRGRPSTTPPKADVIIPMEKRQRRIW